MVLTGIIQDINDQTQCNLTIGFEYWRDYGDWNITVDVNLTTGEFDQDNSSYYYNKLIAHEINITNITFTGLPGQTVNSIDAYPLSVRNTGNSLINISLLGADFIGVTNNTFSIGVDNATYNESSTGTYIQLTESYENLYQIDIQQSKDVYFRGDIPIGTLSQKYQANVSFRSE